MYKQPILALTVALVACASDTSQTTSKGSSSKTAGSKSNTRSDTQTSSTAVGTPEGDDDSSGEGTPSNARSAASNPANAIASLLPMVSWPKPPDGLYTEKITDAPTFHVIRPSDLSSLDKPMPVVVWANGGCLRSDFTWVPMFNHWAEAGFIVLSLTGAGSDTDVLSMIDFTTDAQHKQLIDWVIAQNKEGPYAGKIDVDRIVVAGNSCGGVTALQVASQDDRLAAVFVLSGSSAVGSVDKEVMAKIKVPVGYIVGGSEDVAGANAKGDYEAMNEGLPAMIVHRRAGDHPTVSMDPMILPENAEISRNWLKLALYGDKQAYNDLQSPDVCDGCTPGDWTLESKNLDKLLDKAKDKT